MQTELKREWLLQLINVCSGLTDSEHSYLGTLITRMNENHVVELVGEELDDDSLFHLLERNMLKWVKQDKHVIILPKFLSMGNDLSGIGISLTVKVYEGELMVSKEFQKYKALKDDSVS